MTPADPAPETANDAVPVRKAGAGVRWRLFLTCFLIFGLHFATNVVREHYPALALIYGGDFVLDEYAGLHDDIFEHSDGHHYINNQVTTSVLCAPVLLLGRPALDVLRAKGKAAAARSSSEPEPSYDTQYAKRAHFFKEVRKRGIALQLGGLTALASVFFMAPVSALLVVLMFDVLLARGVALKRATWLALVFGLGTPVFYRTASLNHNHLMAVATFASFLILFRAVSCQGSRAKPPCPGRNTFLAAGFFAGLTFALDYSGVISLLALFAYALVIARATGGNRALWQRGAWFVAGTLPPVLLLWGTQWAQFGNPFLPAQVWMANPNEHVNTGFRGMSIPQLDLVFANLFDLDWGLFTFAPVLLFALVPLRWLRTERPILPGRERIWVGLFCLAVLLFSSGNQFARLQWNTGFRYLMPLVPVLFLACVDGLQKLDRRWAWGLAGLAVAHTWVLSMARYTPPLRGDQNAIAGSWERVLTEGVQFPWHSVLRRTGSLDVPLLSSSLFPYLALLGLGTVLFVLWRRVPSFSRTP